MGEIPKLVLLLPESLPQSKDEIGLWRTGHVTEALRLSLSSSSIASDAETLMHIRAALNALPPPRLASSSMKANRSVANSDSHDEYCRIARANNERPLEVFVGSVLTAFKEFLEDTIEGDNSLSHEQWFHMRLAFDSILRFIEGDPDSGTEWAYRQTWAKASDQEQQCDPFARWIRGHHVFLVLIQCVITSLNCFLNAHKARNSELSASTLDLTAKLFDGCSAALHFAGNFSPVAYEKVVRPTIMPPLTPAGMSGVLARDHDYLVRLLRSQKDVFSSLGGSLTQGYGRFVTAFENTYEAHKLVCSHFVGDERPSLLSRNEQAEAAVEVLDKVKNIRLRSFHEV